MLVGEEVNDLVFMKVERYIVTSLGQVGDVNNKLLVSACSSHLNFMSSQSQFARMVLVVKGERNSRHTHTYGAEKFPVIVEDLSERHNTQARALHSGRSLDELCSSPALYTAHRNACAQG